MKNPIFKISVFISLLGHLAVFSIFSLSFGSNLAEAHYASVSFWGQLFSNSQVTQPLGVTEANLRNARGEFAGLINRYVRYNIMKCKSTLFTGEPDRTALNKVNNDSDYSSKSYLPSMQAAFPVSNGWYQKPPFTLISRETQKVFAEKITPTLPLLRKNEPSIILHPLLPHSFPLYFKDRQVAHVELMFKIVTLGQRNSIVIKRKISSGNLEVDLLSMRYIGYYLFIQQANFTPNEWQTVKIDLSAKND